MSEKEPLVSTAQPSAPPPAYKPPAPYTPPPQGGYQAAPSSQVSNTAVYIQPTHQHTRRVVVELKPPDNYLVLSIITMVLFCWIFGLIGLLVGMQVNSLWLSGNREEAMRRSRQARLWNVVGMMSGAALYVFIAVVCVGVDVAATS